jgi:hypothetical protein
VSPQTIHQTIPAKDFVTKQEIPGKTVTRYRFQVYDLTTFDSNNPPEPAIWERGMNESDQVLYWFEKGITELTIMRNGNAGSQQTTYNIFPANR